MISYETYKNLTRQQKEEYKYKFKDGKKLDFVTPFFIVMVAVCITIILVFVSYLFITDPKFIEYQEDVGNIYYMAISILNFMTFLTIVMIFVEIFHFLYLKTAEWLWIKKNNIQIRYSETTEKWLRILKIR